MPPIVPLHLAHILRPLGTERIVLKLALHRPPPSVRNIHIPVASIISLRPTNKLIPVPTLASLKGVVTLAERFRREFEPGRIVGVAVDVLQEAVEAVLDVMIEVVLLWGASVGGGGEFLDLDETVHLMESTEDIDAFGLVPREPLGTWQAILRGEFVRQSDGSWTYIQSSPQRVSLFLGTHGWAVLGARVDGHRYIADQSSPVRALRWDAGCPKICRSLCW